MKNNFWIKIFMAVMVFSLFLGTSLPAMASNQTITVKMDLKNELNEDLTSIKLAVSGTGNRGNELLTKPVLSNVKFVNAVTSIGMGAFGRTVITDLKLPESLPTIGYGACSNCTKLKTVNIPDGVKRIENQAFAQCSALETVNLGKIEYLGDSTFCNALV